MKADLSNQPSHIPEAATGLIGFFFLTWLAQSRKTMAAKSAGFRAGITESTVPSTYGFLTGLTDLYFHSMGLTFATIGVFTGHSMLHM